MNTILFKEHTDMLLEILEKSNISQTEKDFRKRKILKVYNDMKKNNVINKEYYHQSHEIRSLEFLSKYQNLKITSDSKNEVGCDFKLFDSYNIECVCSSSGDKKKNGLDEFDGFGVFDYSRKEQILLTRLTQSIREKKNFYDEHIANGSIKKNEPYIIFLSLGDLTYGTFAGTYGFMLNKVLFGVGYEILYLDKKTNKLVKKEYSHNSVIINHNGSEIDCNIFCNKGYECISAILFTSANLDEHYTPDNTFLFINPFTINKVHANKFQNLIYWKAFSNNEGIAYYPRYKGKNLNNNLK